MKYSGLIGNYLNESSSTMNKTKVKVHEKPNAIRTEKTALLINTHNNKK